jgi:hypothetical protein
MAIRIIPNIRETRFKDRSPAIFWIAGPVINVENTVARTFSIERHKRIADLFSGRLSGIEYLGHEQLHKNR